MPESIYKLVFNDPLTSKLAKNNIDLTIYTRHSVNLNGKCTSYMLSKGTKQPVKVDCKRRRQRPLVMKNGLPATMS